MNKWLTQVKSALLTALIVIVAAQMVMGLVVPLMPFIITGLIGALVVGYLVHRNKRL